MAIAQLRAKTLKSSSRMRHGDKRAAKSRVGQRSFIAHKVLSKQSPGTSSGIGIVNQFH